MRRSRERSGPIVLIVDDTADARDLYREYLTARGFRVATAPDGDSGIAAARRYRPDVIVMDLAMPWVDGITATRRLKADARTRNVPVILLTGHAYLAIDQGALEAGAAVFLTKPCLPEDLEAQIRRLQKRSSAAA
ncbi:MAG TPA: response regulator [Methylomirabilota bacterium]|jgi:DNA-binding response OmpR family regulator